MKKLLCCLLIALVLPAFASAEVYYDSARIEFEDGFALTVPSDWVSYAVDEESAARGILYCLGAPDASRTMYIQRWAADYTSLDALREDLLACSGITLRSDTLFAGDVEFLLYNFTEADATGCATLFNGGVLNFLFLPQSDDENMLIAATIITQAELTAAG